jgi:coproporphyrinogen III oxidase
MGIVRQFKRRDQKLHKKAEQLHDSICRAAISQILDERRKRYMKINFAQEFQTFGGEVLKDGEGNIFTLKGVCATVLLGQAQNEKATGEEKMKRYDLAKKIWASEGECDVKAEDVATLKKLVGESYLPLIVGQAFKMLEGE